MERNRIGGALLITFSLTGAARAQGTARVTDSSRLPPQERYGLRLQYREFRPSLTGDAQKGADGKDGTVVDMNDDLGIAKKRTFDVRGTIQLKKGWKVRGSYTPLDYHGDVEAHRAFNYGATRYQRFDHVVTSVKGAYYSGDLEWDFVKGPRGFLGAVVGAKIFDVDATVVSATQNARELDTITAPVPVIGLATRVYAGHVSLEGELAGLSAGSKGSMLEAEVSVRVLLSDRLAAMGGYRHLSLDGKDNQDQVKLHLGGWQFGLELSL